MIAIDAILDQSFKGDSWFKCVRKWYYYYHHESHVMLLSHWSIIMKEGQQYLSSNSQLWEYSLKIQWWAMNARISLGVSNRIHCVWKFLSYNHLKLKQHIRMEIFHHSESHFYNLWPLITDTALKYQIFFLISLNESCNEQNSILTW